MKANFDSKSFFSGPFLAVKTRHDLAHILSGLNQFLKINNAHVKILNHD
jgi:hypothetical protein